MALGRLIHARADVIRYSVITLDELTRDGYNTNILPLSLDTTERIKYVFMLNVDIIIYVL